MSQAIGVILFARMSSSRLPGKMLRPIGPCSLLERVVRRARLLERPMLLATSTESSDDPLVAAAQALGLDACRGPLEDVLQRACLAGEQAGFTAFARLCGDRPFLPLEDMERAIRRMEASLGEAEPLDLITTRLPHPVPAGLMTEVIRTSALRTLERQVTSREEREHVTLGFYSRPERYRVQPLASPLQTMANVHLSVDTEHDLQRIGELIEQWPALDLPAQQAAEQLIARDRTRGTDAPEAH